MDLWSVLSRLWGVVTSTVSRVVEAVTGVVRRTLAWLFPASPMDRALEQVAADGIREEATGPEWAKDDETALARMLASEDRNGSIKVVIGWITVQKARRASKSLYDVVTSGKGYGPQDRRHLGQGVVYASTARTPSKRDRELARGLLNGTIQPSAEIRAKKAGGWIERDQGVPDERILAFQDKWNEGIYARVQGSRWVLFSPDAPRLVPQPGQSAGQALDGLPPVLAIESERAVA